MGIWVRHLSVSRGIRTMKKTQILILVAAAALVAGCAGTHHHQGAASPDNDYNVLTGGPISGTTLRDLPPPVRDTLRRYEPHAEISDIDKVRRDGQVVYKINFTQPTKNPTLWITDEGRVWWESSVDR